MVLKILAFNTVTELCSVAIKINHRIYMRNIVAPRLHAEKILPMINQLLIDTGVTLQSLDCIVFDRGPGSFIGLRIGINIAQGLALGADLPLIGVSSLEILAQGAYRMFSATHVIATIDARLNELYWAMYSYNTCSNDWIICKNGMCLVTVANAQKIIRSLDGKWTIIGTGWNNSQQLQSCINDSDVIVEKQFMYPNAQDMLFLGMHSYKDKKFLTPNQVMPIYLHVMKSI